MSAAPIDVEQLVDEGPFGAFQLRVIVLCGLVALLDGFDLQTMAFVTPTLAAEWQIAPADFRLVLSASLMGLAVGALGAGPLSDACGRRAVLLGSLLLLAASTLACATVTSPGALFLWRFVTGLGLGGSMPNLIALTAEYAPRRNRALLISLMLCGLPLGGALGGQAAAALIAAFGWHAVFIAGGIVPLLLFALAWPWLPESIKFLALRPARRAELLRVLAFLRPGTVMPDGASFAAAATGAAATPIAGLFRAGRTGGTLLLWTIFFLNLYAMYFLASWLPTVLQSADWPRHEALTGTSIFHYGGLAGGLLFSHLIDRHSPFRILPAVYLAAMLALVGAGLLIYAPGAASAALALAGLGIIGAQFCLNALAAAFYPTMMRATGVGWALGIGRLGAITSPLIAGAILAAQWPPAGFFFAAALPLLACAICVLCMARLQD